MQHIIRRLVAFSLVAVLSIATSAQAHHRGDRALQTLKTSVDFEGTIRTITVEDRIDGSTTVYATIIGANGAGYLLQGSWAESLAAGSTYVVHGATKDRTLDVDSADVAQAPAQVATQVAKSVQVSRWVSGILRLGHADNFNGDKSSFFYSISSDDGGLTNLALADGIDRLANGMKVTAEGTTQADGEIFTDRIIILAHPEPSQAKADVLKAAVTNSVLVLPIKFPNNAVGTATTYAADPYTIAAINTAVFGASPTQSAAEYYKEVSYGQHLLAGVVANKSGAWLTTASRPPLDANGKKQCDINQISTLAEASAVAAGYNIASYTNVVYLFENQSFVCGWSGLAYVGWGRAYINQTTSLLVIAHELGHNFGLLHAASLDCGTEVITQPCTSAEYGDPFDVMGNQRAMHFNAFQKNYLGWIPPTSVYKHKSGTATYTISPLEQSGAAHYGISVSANSDRTYWIEYRQPLGFDALMSAYPVAGAQLHVAVPFESICGGCSDDTEYLDLTPTTAAFTDGALLVGQSYNDKFGVKISVVSATPTALTVSVTAPPRPTFNDVPTSHWAYSPIETLYWNQVTAGCSGSPPVFCPTSIVTRAEMAVFMEREKLGFTHVYHPTGKVFSDVPLTHWAAGPIEQFYADGIDAGCSTAPLKFCPDSAISRAQMAVMLIKGLYGKTYVPPAATGTVFTDVPKTLPLAAWIEQLSRTQVTLGCTATTYCPNGTITRAEMAVFFSRQFNLQSAP